MPVITFHLTEGQYEQDKVQYLLVRASEFFAEVLACPVDRTRAFTVFHQPSVQAVGGKLVSYSGDHAPYFSFIVLEGRPLETRQRLLAGFTDLVVDILGVERSLVRGGVVPVSPENWSIGGVPAAVTRADEVLARAKAAAS